MIENSTEDFILSLKRGEEIVKITLKARTIINPSIDYYMIEDSNIGYIGITAFSKNLDSQMKKALNDLESKNMTSLIIDLRNNTGGYLDAASNVANIFLEKDKTIYSLDYKGNVTHYYDTTSEKKDYDIVVLINKNSASASEILAAALKESYGAKLVGETTFGKGRVQQTMNLDDGTMVKYTSARWLTPSGTCIDGVGILPDYPISNEEVLNDEGNIIDIIDKQLEEAITILKNN